MKLELEEVFDQPVETVWRAITDPVRLARWLLENDFEPRVGHRFTLREAPTAQWRGWLPLAREARAFVMGSKAKP